MTGLSHGTPWIMYDYTLGNVSLFVIGLQLVAITLRVHKICEEDASKVFRRQKIRKAKGPDGVLSRLPQSLCCSAIIHLHMIFNRSLSCVKSPPASNAPPSSLYPRKPKIKGLNDYRPVALTSVVMKSFERLVLAHLKDITGPCWTPCSLLTEQTGLWMMQSTWDCTTSSNI